METKLEYMRRVCNELEVALNDVTTKALHIADMLGLDINFDEGPEADEVLRKLKQQVRIGEEYMKPFEPKKGWPMKPAHTFENSIEEIARVTASQSRTQR